jgi:FKBP-type peptidyl-prolyl cis-trans isomerase
VNLRFRHFPAGFGLLSFVGWLLVACSPSTSTPPNNSTPYPISSSQNAKSNEPKEELEPTIVASKPKKVEPEMANPPPADENPAQGNSYRIGGMLVEDLKAGTGNAAGVGDKVTVHYVGTLEDGTKFDSSRDRTTPFSFGIGKGHVIAGWEEGLPGMKIGGVRRLTIPFSKAYGEKGRPPTIPPRATLIFEIELLSIEKP